MSKSSNPSQLLFRAGGSGGFSAIQRAILFTFGAALYAAFHLVFSIQIATPSSTDVHTHQNPSRHLLKRNTPDANRMVRRGFSVTRTVDIFRTTREDKRDFLTLYLRNDLPDYISKADIEMIEQSIRTFHEERSPIASNFKRGMLYFFLAVTETIWLVEGNSIDSIAVVAHWSEAESNLRRAEAIGRELANELERILQAADIDSDGQLTPSELRQIILERE